MNWGVLNMLPQLMVFFGLPGVKIKVVLGGYFS
jgi:hypothetical protein